MWSWLWIKVTEMWQSKNWCHLSQSLSWIWMEFDVLLRLIGLMNFILILPHQISIQRKTPNSLIWFCPLLPSKYSHTLTHRTEENNLYVGLHSDVYRLISFKCGVIANTSKQYCLIWVWMTLTFIQSHICMRKQKLLHSFSLQTCDQFGWNLVCYHDMLMCSSLC